ncbi:MULTISPECIES: pyridoxal kinase PdxY [unclassified Chelatococcus]|uniref:pyridoxal kinase PdxY n=1 Tax=unclassified Chelatococcus TaxID=2638111 RepID=UPI001BCCB5C1|nr:MULTISPECIES: pyridoxal kinase PdxY [unclassified Chelatococcus]CAH1666877.1 Pyridoxal kinase PdxY [Hyphomicrobiales bacterium]MBS7737908.1 pyridoxal kinase PdxY [Chelatococcus sp. HY11]MBX3546644.1 pyridoxal kinase PdxY [Chelatococcus sp.]MCO5079362.1 pyridoxal kinase PdxY [Chelatococcus sp.]CAH1680233.1 Pyridoxal kinase PdxY [Hyphomicrobiales bacterium]
MNILSIQSHVAYGHVGNAAAVFPMQRLGVEVWPIHTVQFSNHTGYGAWKGRVFDGPAIEELVEGIAERGALPRCDGVLSGYMGAVDIGNAILSTVAKVRAANSRALYCCDPVIGDVGRGIFVRPGIAEFMRDQAVPAADVVTPNQFELALLAGHEVVDLADVRRAVAAVHALGPRVIMVTSLDIADMPADALDLLASDGTSLWRVRTPRLDLRINGAGDAIAALFFVHYLRTGSAAQALTDAASSIHGLLKRTAEAGAREILLVAAQDEFVSPSQRFAAELV